MHRSTARGVVLALSCSLTVACSDAEPTTEPGAAAIRAQYPQGTPPEARIAPEVDEGALEARVRRTRREITIGGVSYAAPATSGLGTQDFRGGPHVSLTLVAEVDPPTAVVKTVAPGGVVVDGARERLQAASVSVVGDLAVVGYLMRGEAFGGAIDVIDISDPDAPVLRSSAVFDLVDVSATEIVPSSKRGVADLYVAASTADPAYPGSSVVERVALRDGKLSLAESFRLPLPGLAATCVTVADGRLFGTGGERGGLVAYDLGTGQKVGERLLGGLGDARWVSVDGSKVVVPQGGDGGVLHVLGRSAEPAASYAFPGADRRLAKSMAKLIGNRAYVAAGRAGLHIVNIATGKTLGELPLPAESGYDAEDVTTNALAIDANRIYLANGGLGTYLALTPDEAAQDDDTPVQPQYIGKIDLPGSANHVAAGKGVLFVASGLGGLSIIRVE